MEVAKKNILIVDDEQRAAESLAIGLRRAGYSPQIANNGLEGESKLKCAEFNFILCDINMPDMNGWEFAKKVKSITSAHFIFYTADSRMYRKAEFNSSPLLIKPLELDTLLKLLNEENN